MSAQNSAASASPPGRPFEKGVSGNPGGRPKGIARMVREVAGDDDGRLLAQLFTRAALSGYMTYVTRDGKTAEEKISPRERLVAGSILLDRGWGKPPQFAPIEDDNPLEMDERTAELAAMFGGELDEIAAKRAEKSAARAGR